MFRFVEKSEADGRNALIFPKWNEFGCFFSSSALLTTSATRLNIEKRSDIQSQCVDIFWNAIAWLLLSHGGWTTEESWRRKESEKWIRQMSEGGASLQPSLSGRVHSSFSRLGVTALLWQWPEVWQWRHGGLMRCRRGLASRGSGAEMVKPDVVWGGATTDHKRAPDEGHDVTHCPH